MYTSTNRDHKDTIKGAWWDVCSLTDWKGEGRRFNHSISVKMAFINVQFKFAMTGLQIDWQRLISMLRQASCKGASLSFVSMYLYCIYISRILKCQSIVTSG